MKKWLGSVNVWKDLPQTPEFETYGGRCVRDRWIGSP